MGQGAPCRPWRRFTHKDSMPLPSHDEEDHQGPKGVGEKNIILYRRVPLRSSGSAITKDRMVEANHMIRERYEPLVGVSREMCFL